MYVRRQAGLSALSASPTRAPPYRENAAHTDGQRFRCSRCCALRDAKSPPKTGDTPHARVRTHSRHSHRSAHGHIQEAAASKQTRVSGTLWRASYVVLYGQLSTTIKRLSLQLSEPSCRALAASGPMRPRRSRWRHCTSPPAPHSTAQQAPFGCSPLPLWLLPDDSRWMLWRFQGVCAVVCATAAQGDRLWPPEVTVRTACLRHRLGRRQRDAEA